MTQEQKNIQLYKYTFYLYRKKSLNITTIDIYAYDEKQAKKIIHLFVKKKQKYFGFIDECECEKVITTNKYLQRFSSYDEAIERQYEAVKGLSHEYI